MSSNDSTSVLGIADRTDEMAALSGAETDISVSMGFLRIRRDAGTGYYFGYANVETPVDHTGVYTEPVLRTLEQPRHRLRLPLAHRTAALSPSLTILPDEHAQRAGRGRE
ncbi:MAG: hypothetical protein H0T89_19360 [Deltaproteobacteria bacterium]|nr:hypothetical protein [Deltaproteobacteria bacterium]MDQ3365737.1 hypothetical protein [Myxococcota bacterium]